MNYELKEVLYNNIFKFIKSKKLNEISNDDCIIILDMIKLIINILGSKYLQNFKENFKELYKSIKIKKNDIVLIIDETKYYEKENYGIITDVNDENIIIEYLFTVKKEKDNKIENNIINIEGKFIMDLRKRIITENIKAGYKLNKDNLVIYRFLNNDNIPIKYL